MLVAVNCITSVSSAAPVLITWANSDNQGVATGSTVDGVQLLPLVEHVGSAICGQGKIARVVPLAPVD